MAHKYLKEEHHIFRESLKKFLEKEVTPHFPQWEKERNIPRDFWNKLGERGFLAPWVDERYGGFNADFGYSVVICEELQRAGGGGVSSPVLHSDVVVPYIALYGNEEQKQRWLPGCVSGELITAVAMTEPGTGSDLGNISTTAIKKGDHYIINGEKIFITNGLKADLVVVACKTDPGASGHKSLSLIVVEAGTPGFKRGKKLDKVGQHTADTSELIFEDAKVPAANLLGEENKGFYYLMAKLQQERLMCALGAQSSAEEALELTVDYVKQRKAFGKAISEFQNTQFKIAEMATELQLGRTFLDDLIVKHMEGKDIVKEVSMAKWWITDTAKKVIGECMQLHGGYGYMEEYKIARKYRDIAVTSIFAGTNEIMKQIIAKKIGL